MRKLIGTAIFAVAVAVSAPAFAESEEECLMRFDRVDANNDGYIAGIESQDYFDALENAGMLSVDANKDGRLNINEFMAACLKDVFKDIKLPEQ
jgi:Ca2+-binding EF-hand superfamily protein